MIERVPPSFRSGIRNKTVEHFSNKESCCNDIAENRIDSKIYTIDQILTSKLGTELSKRREVFVFD